MLRIVLILHFLMKRAPSITAPKQSFVDALDNTIKKIRRGQVSGGVCWNIVSYVFAFGTSDVFAESIPWLFLTVLILYIYTCSTVTFNFFATVFIEFVVGFDTLRSSSTLCPVPYRRTTGSTAVRCLVGATHAALIVPHGKTTISTTVRCIVGTTRSVCTEHGRGSGAVAGFAVTAPICARHEHLRVQAVR